MDKEISKLLFEEELNNYKKLWTKNNNGWKTTLIIYLFALLMGLLNGFGNLSILEIIFVLFIFLPICSMVYAFLFLVLKDFIEIIWDFLRSRKK